MVAFPLAPEVALDAGAGDPDAGGATLAWVLVLGAADVGDPERGLVGDAVEA